MYRRHIALTRANTREEQDEGLQLLDGTLVSLELLAVFAR